MAIDRQVELLEPINLSEHLEKVELYLGQVCQIAGISKMQLDYWTNKAQIPTKGKKQRIYDIDAGEDADARDELDVPRVVRVQPRVPRNRALDCAQTADDVPQRGQSRRDAVA